MISRDFYRPAPPMMAKKTSMAPSSFAAVSVVCQCAMVAVLVHTRLELSAVQEMAPAGPRRSLLEPAVMDDLREDNLRLTERIAALETEHRHITELCERDRGTAQNATAGLSQRVAELEQSARRRTQGAEPEPEPEPAVGENVKIIKPQVVRCGGPGDTTANDVGTFDYAQCADRAFATCHAEACDGHGGGHRRAQAGAGYGGAGSTCSAADLPSRTDAITAECCDEPSEDCTGGYPRTCNAGCAALFLPFWDDCHSALGKDSRNFEPVVALCEASALVAPTLAEQLNVECSDGTAAAACVPECSEELHGFLMLLNIEGDDSKLSCELHRGLYSWVGAATDGGFLGFDFDTFFSAVVTGAAGVYVGMLVEDGGIRTALTITPGQTVSVNGDQSLPGAPLWGFGGLTVQERGSLSMVYTGLQGPLTVQVGGELKLTRSVLGGNDVNVAGGTLTVVRSSVDTTITVVAGGTARLSGCTVDTRASLMITAGSLSLASMAVPANVLDAAQEHLRVKELRLSAVTVTEHPEWGELTGTMTDHGGVKTIDPPGFGAGAGVFTVSSGPCTVSESGRCVGRPGGYLPNEECAITVGGGGGVLGPCGVFDTSFDIVTLDGSRYDHSNCPHGAALAVGGSVGWESNGANQGNAGDDVAAGGCDAVGLCGLPYSEDGLGGGWQICFAA